jgi:hypothetical protein
VKPPIVKQLSDSDAEIVRRSHADAIAEMQGKPAMGMQVLADIVIPNNSSVIVAHRLGRTPQMVIISPVRGAAAVGIVGEFRSGVDRRQAIRLAANGFGADVTVDVTVF